MPRQYTQRRIVGAQIAAADDWNKELNSAGAEINGQLDQNQLPLDAFGLGKFAAPTVSVDYDGTLNGTPGWLITHSYGQSQSYHVSKHCGDVPQQQPFLKWTEWDDDEWTLGWIKVASKRFVFVAANNYAYPGSIIRLEAVEGMLVGEVMIDAEWRSNFQIEQYQNNFLAYLYDGSFIEVGAFVNDVCVGRTDEQWLGGRFTYVVPFSVPIGTQEVVVDIRFRLILKRYEKFADPANPAPGQGTPTITDTFSKFRIYDSLIWVRNQYR